jgi:hypothetical protein
MRKRDREKVARDFEWSRTCDATVEATKEVLGCVFDLLRLFGWVDRPEQDGVFCWTVFNGKGERATIETYIGSPVLYVRAPGHQNFINNQLYLLRELIELKHKGFGTAPSTDDLIALNVCMLIDAGGLDHSEEGVDIALAVMCEIACGMADESR